MSNPALSNNPALNGKTLTAEELNRIYNRPAADVQRPGVDPEAAAPGAPQPPVTGSDEPMTYENTINKTAMLFVIVLAGAAIGWFIPGLAIIGAIVGLVLGLVNSFKKEPNVGLIVGYAAAQGIFLGGISVIFEQQFNGIVLQAIIGTFSVFGAVLLLFRSGKVRTSPRMNKIVMVAMVGYLVFSLVNVVMMMTGAASLRTGGLGLAIGAIAVLLAAYSLVMDFELIQNGVRNRVPERYGWAAAFGLTVTLIWLYLEILRIISIFRGDD